VWVWVWVLVWVWVGVWVWVWVKSKLCKLFRFCSMLQFVGVCCNML